MQRVQEILESRVRSSPVAERPVSPTPFAMGNSDEAASEVLHFDNFYQCPKFSLSDTSYIVEMYIECLPKGGFIEINTSALSPSYLSSVVIFAFL